MWKDCETIADLLDFDYLVDVTKKIILNDNLTPSTIGIYGDWGCGKSSLMDMIKSELSNENGNKVLCLKFNGWLFEGYEDAKVALIGSILDEIKKKRSLSGKAKETLIKLYDNTDFIKLTSKLAKVGIDLLLTGGILTLTDITIDTIKNALKEKGTEVEKKDIEEILKSFKGKEVRNSIKTFHEDFENLLKQTKIKRLVVFIDELDRCSHDTILDTLEAIRLFLFAKGTSFVIGADERQIRYAVQMKYPNIEGNQIDIGKEYLEKLIQYPIRIPQLGQKEVEFYIMCLFFEKDFKEDIPKIKTIIKEEKDKSFLDFELTYELINNKSPDLANSLKDTISLSKQISSVLAKGLHGNPRHCKRFLNAMELRMQMASFRKIDLDRRILAKIMLLEYFRDIFYARLAELQANANGKPEEITLIEMDKWDEAKELGMWKDDLWIKEWIKIDPVLSGVDLRAYFYFSRESLKSTSLAKQQNLSTQGETILEKLLSVSDSAREEAIVAAESIPEYESIIIHKILISKLESSSKLEMHLLQSFIEWSETNKALYIETIAFLERVSSNRMRASFLPLIAEFTNKLNDKTKIIELLSKWKKENPKLKSAIEFELENLK